MGSRSHRDELANSLLSVAIVSVPPRFATGPTEFAGQLSISLITQIGPIEFEYSVKPSFGFTLTLAHRSHRVDQVGPTEMPNGHIMNQIGPTEFSELVPPSLVICV